MHHLDPVLVLLILTGGIAGLIDYCALRIPQMPSLKYIVHISIWMAVGVILSHG